jgi:uncharacterized membrane-anchored protein
VAGWITAIIYQSSHGSLGQQLKAKPHSWVETFMVRNGQRSAGPEKNERQTLLHVYMGGS